MRIKNPRSYIVTVILGVAVILSAMGAMKASGSRSKIDYAGNLDKLAVTVDGQELTLKDLAFYVAYEESIVENEAEIYNPNDTNKYWNLHIDGEFIRLSSREIAMDMAIHDEIFYQMAVDQDMELVDEERSALDNDFSDFWDDLSDYNGAENMGVDKNTLYESMEKIALSDKAQAVYAGVNGGETEDYDFDGDKYKIMLEDHEYKINTSLWEKIRFGNISIKH